MLRQGQFVADICYLLPEGAPNVFVPPPSAFTGDAWTPDRRGYNFDGCPPSALMEMAEVEDGKIVFPGGTSYHLLVLPDVETMTPELLEKIESLVRQGATVVGSPPQKSPSLTGYPECDQKVTQLVDRLWGNIRVPPDPLSRKLGKGTIHWGGALSHSDAANYARDPSLEMSEEEKNDSYSEGLFGHDGTRPGTPYPDYESTALILEQMGISENFSSSGQVRYGQRQMPGMDMYFVANRTDQFIHDICSFRTRLGHPSLWDPISGEIRPLPQYQQNGDLISLGLEFDAYQSYFVLFSDQEPPGYESTDTHENFPSYSRLTEVSGSWEVAFDPAWGGPEKIVFDQLADWTHRPEEGIRYYSGIATYHNSFNFRDADDPSKKIYLDLGQVHDMARVYLNNQDLGIVWTAPWRVDVTEHLQAGENHLEIQVVNRWPNRMIGDEFLPYDGVEDGQLPEWLKHGKPRESGRFTFTTLSCYTKDSPLLPSGLLGPLTLMKEE
jgi:hypothetical protein